VRGEEVRGEQMKGNLRIAHEFAQHRDVAGIMRYDREVIIMRSYDHMIRTCAASANLSDHVVTRCGHAHYELVGPSMIICRMFALTDDD
jgi:hypothetical protein